MATKSKRAPTAVENSLADAVLARSAEGPYILLGVPPDATAVMVKNAHRSLASLLHPDRNPGNLGAAAAMSAVNAAYSLLTDAKARGRYDVVSGAVKKCPICNGTGKANRMQGFKVYKHKCLDCNGTGNLTVRYPLN